MGLIRPTTSEGNQMQQHDDHQAGDSRASRKRFVSIFGTFVLIVGVGSMVVAFLVFRSADQDDSSSSKLPDVTPRDTAPVYPGSANAASSDGSSEGLVDTATYPARVRLLHQDMPAAFELMKASLKPEDRSKLDLNLPTDYSQFSGSDAAKYLSIACYTASVESKDGGAVDVDLARETLATVVAKQNPTFSTLRDTIDGTHSIATVLEAVGPDYPRLGAGTDFLGHTMPKDGGQVVRMQNNLEPGVSLALFETIDVGGEKTLLYVSNFDVFDRSTQQALQETFGHQ